MAPTAAPRPAPRATPIPSPSPMLSVAAPSPVPRATPMLVPIARLAPTAVELGSCSVGKCNPLGLKCSVELGQPLLMAANPAPRASPMGAPRPTPIAIPAVLSVATPTAAPRSAPKPASRANPMLIRSALFLRSGDNSTSSVVSAQTVGLHAVHMLPESRGSYERHRVLTVILGMLLRGDRVSAVCGSSISGRSGGLVEEGFRRSYADNLIIGASCGRIMSKRSATYSRLERSGESNPTGSFYPKPGTDTGCSRRHADRSR